MKQNYKKLVTEICIKHNFEILSDNIEKYDIDYVEYKRHIVEIAINDEEIIICFGFKDAYERLTQEYI